MKNLHVSILYFVISRIIVEKVTLIGVFRALVISTIGFLCFAGQAFAHADLVMSVPPVNGTVSKSPSEIDLHFSEGVEASFSSVQISGPNKNMIPTGVPALKSGDDTTLLVPILRRLTNGSYTVTWHALSIDGHKSEGRFTLTVKFK